MSSKWFEWFRNPDSLASKEKEATTSTDSYQISRCGPYRGVQFLTKHKEKASKLHFKEGMQLVELT
jgi:hypothetical protein